LQPDDHGGPPKDPRRLALLRADALVLLLDVQAGPAARSPPALLERCVARLQLLLEGAALLGLPVLSAELDPARLGPTLPALLAKLAAPPLPRLEFSAGASKPLARAVLQAGRQQVLLAGLGAEGAIFQTARDLALGGLFPFVLQDAVLSRTQEGSALGLQLCERAGAAITSVEAALCDLLGSAGAPEAQALFSLLEEGRFAVATGA
jgi:Isochorismatase family